ncbi:glycosyltransferase [Turicibacter sanguinis]|uniref:glycosyltransferase n=1 Tax=Turicibacter sanguinis TaxID=154288 RepID=UPI0018A8FB56|nr:glycosyltransferase [Turicibacter sanguinis]MDB8558405.1 glycosyltransferase [Turicibacter sanguinis]MDB8561201.1 glycosyltransferase [Turicibacter sanguinis]
MKKDLLFIIPSLGIGGGEKSLINLLEQIDYKQYNVDLFVLYRQGLFLEFIPNEVNIIQDPPYLKVFQLPLFESIITFLRLHQFSLIYHRIMFFMKNRIKGTISKGEQYSWRHLKKTIGSLDKSYDVAIGYLEKTSNYICVDCVNATKKIGWIHTDYRKLDADKKFDEKYLFHLDYIVTVSDECAEVLKNDFYQLSNRVKVINNIVSAKIIKKMSVEKLDITKEKGEIRIISVGRLSHEKGFDMAIKACRILKDRGLLIKWMVVGDGSDRKTLEQLIDKYNLNHNFILVGASSNPYKYIYQADIYVQPSRFEGKSIAIDEAKILCKPMVVTNFSTVNDQVKNGIDGIIADMNELSLANSIELLIKDRELYCSIKDNLEKTQYGNEFEVEKLYKLIG